MIVTGNYVFTTKNKLSYNSPANLQLLMTEIFKTINNKNPSFMREIFTERTITQITKQ